MPFLAQLTAPDGRTLYVTASDREGLRYCSPNENDAERFPTRELAEQAVREVKQIRMVRDYPHTVLEV